MTTFSDFANKTVASSTDSPVVDGMSPKSFYLDKSAPLAGQDPRLPSSKEALIHAQLYRYAEDLHALQADNKKLKQHHQLQSALTNRLSDSRTTLDQITRFSADIHIVTDAEGTIIQCNPASALLASHDSLMGQKLSNWALPSYRTAFLTLLSNSVLSLSTLRDRYEMRFRCEGTTDSTLFLSVHVLVINNSDQTTRLHWVMHDLTHTREVEFEAAVALQAFRQTKEALFITSNEGEILSVNPSFTRITGYSAEEAIGRSPKMLNSGIQNSDFYQKFWRALKEVGTWQGEVINRRKNGEIYKEWLSISSIRDPAGKVISYIAIFFDMTKILSEVEHQGAMMNIDPLTSLPNHAMFNDRMMQLLLQSRRTSTPFSLFVINIDKFASINSKFGYGAGDQTLLNTSKRIAALLRASDTLARINVDEFALIALAVQSDADIAVLADRIINAVCTPMVIDDHEIAITVRIGCVKHPNHGDSLELLMQHAKAATGQCKAAGGKAFMIYDNAANLTAQTGN
ncbi:MAG: diguanylate cyclase [Pseudomonadota bacterium]